eukprot:jgi/Galph1/933/GphlegSOOS_G5682.1
MTLKTFRPSEIEIRRLVGRQSLYKVVEWEYFDRRDPTAPGVTVEPASLACRLYEAILWPNSGYDQQILLKEYNKDSRNLGFNEIEIFRSLIDFGVDVASPSAPISNLLGSFQATQVFATETFRSQWERALPSVEPPEPNHLFLVFRWEGLDTVGSYFSRRKRKQLLSIPILMEREYQVRAKFIKKIMLLSLKAVELIHQHRIVHLSLSPQSILLNTLQEEQINGLAVKLRDFGFAKKLSALDDESIREARNASATMPKAIANYYFLQDISLLGYSFLLLIFSSFADNDSYARIGYDGLKRLTEELFQLDFEKFRAYCKQDEALVNVVRFLDERNCSGWALIRNMLSSLKKKQFDNDELIVSELLKSYFFQ